MYLDYLDDIVAYYRTGERTASLPHRLMRPTPGGIKDECLSLCKYMVDKNDLKMLATFFGVERDTNSVIRAVGRCDRDRFKPLVNFLKGLTNSTEDLNIELLAWLIDFPGRPFGETYQKIQGSKEEIEKGTKEQKSGTKAGMKEQDKKAPTDLEKDLSHAELAKDRPWIVLRKKVTRTIAALLLLVLAGSYLVLSNDYSSGFENNAVLNLPDNSKGLVYARCVGTSPCKACSNCSSCNWCNSGSTCGTCAKEPIKKTTQKRAQQCQATTKKGTRCSRTVKEGSVYCWQHKRQ